MGEYERLVGNRLKDEKFIKDHDSLVFEEGEEELLRGAEKPEAFEGTLSEEDIDSRRLFPNFRVEESGGWEGSYQEAAKLFKELNRMDGFNAMFSYRFS